MDRKGKVMARGRVAARRGIVLAALLLASASGCVTTDQLVTDLVGNPATVTTVGALWKDQLIVGADPVHHGALIYGLAGRVFLFGPGLTENLAADGNIIVEMYGLVPEQPQAPPALLETWEIKKDDLNRVCQRKDGIGMGYTLNLPWEHYRPDVTQFDIRTRYEPAKGTPIYTRDLVKLAGGPGPEVAGSNRLETGDRRVITSSAAPPAAGAVPAALAAGPPQGVAGPGSPFPPQQPGVVQPAVYPPPQPGWALPPRPPVPQQQTGAAAPAFPVPPQQPAIVQPPVYQAPASGGPIPAPLSGPQGVAPPPAGAGQPALYQAPVQSPYQPQAMPTFPGGGQR